MKYISGLQGMINVCVKTIAIISSARQNQIAGIIETLQAIYPSAKVVIITRYKEHGAQNSFPTEINIVSAIPPGKFNLAKIFLVKRHLIRSIKPDLLVLAYNNPEAVGYRSLKIACTTMLAKKVVGVFYDASNPGQCTFEKIEAKTFLFELLRRPLLFPLELALLLVTLTILAIAKVFHVVSR